jgi:hypothetical protein
VRRILPVAIVVAVVTVVGLAWWMTRDETGARVDTRPTGSEEQLPPVEETGIDWSDPVALPPPKREDYRSEFVNDVEGYRFWPRSSRRITPDTAYWFDTGHCGLSFLADFDGSFWQPNIGPDAVAPGFFFNQDIGAVALVDADRAVYRSSNGVEVEMERLRGSVVALPCE